MTSVASSQFSHCIQEAPQIKSTWKSLFQENTAYRPWNLDEYEYNEYNFHAANIIFKNYFQPFKNIKTIFSFQALPAQSGMEFGPWDIRCNGLFYPFIVDSPTRRDHHSKTEWLSYVLWLWKLHSKNKTQITKSCLRCEGFKSSPSPDAPRPSTSRSCVAALLLPKSHLSLPTNAQLKNTETGFWRK